MTEVQYGNLTIMDQVWDSKIIILGSTAHLF